ncbi:M23 family metallopeptidase [Luteimonas terricola]|uniref:Peptidase M23 n=1 Tax=Luteimonas terricola TaxID=645597 RepID=A0ABQ2EJQ4_9GAMM|nr:M23 family metallopeptidase [Luteimonas terricola]GGK10135.1 peptidase M23 [Luteimonas terricola]
MIGPASLYLALLAGFALSFPVPAAATETLPLPAGCGVAYSVVSADAPATAVAPAFPPVQLDIRTPFEPSSFNAGGYSYLVYELQLLNHSEDALAINGIDVLAATASDDELVFSLAGERLHDQLNPIGGGTLDDAHPLGAGRSATVYLCLAFGDGAQVPSRLRHRVHLHGATAEGPPIGSRHNAVKVLASPVLGNHWLADNGLALDRHHRPGLFVAGGAAQISRRYAIDWKQRIDGKVQSGDPLDVRTYHAYAQPVFAVADAVVVQARDGLPDNVPRTSAGFTPALPLSMETLAGNTVVLDLGDGQYAHYAHLQPGSVIVAPGQRVRSGELLARIGNSGDARWPHLHFQVTTGPDIMDSEGVPFVINQFRAKGADGNWTDRRLEFPLGGDEVDL